MRKMRNRDNWVAAVMEALVAAGTEISLIPWVVTQGEGSCLEHGPSFRDWKDSRLAAGGGEVILGLGQTDVSCPVPESVTLC